MGNASSNVSIDVAPESALGAVGLGPVRGGCRPSVVRQYWDTGASKAVGERQGSSGLSGSTGSGIMWKLERQPQQSAQSF